VTTEAKGATAQVEAEEKKLELKGEPILKGLGVSPGIATGTVRIVHKAEDLSKVQKGDVLVTEMTSPDMVVAMSRPRHPLAVWWQVSMRFLAGRPPHK
jgi:pyruvate,water dikinase